MQHAQTAEHDNHNGHDCNGLIGFTRMLGEDQKEVDYAAGCQEILQAVSQQLAPVSCHAMALC